MKKNIKAIKKILLLFWQDFINFIHLFDRISSSLPYAEEAIQLKKEGIVLKKNILPKEACDQYKQKILALLETHRSSVKLPSGTYLNFRSQDVSEGSDHGMVDLFNIDKSIKIDEKEAIDQYIMEIIKLSTRQKVIPYRLNAYVNQGVQGTRTYHIDDTHPAHYKAFIYLTDVKDLSFGPYSFIKRSHQFCLSVYLNLLRNIFSKRNATTDMKSYQSKQILNTLASKGTLIISNQNGIHRGLPQAADRLRIALVFNYMVISKLSYLHKSAKKAIEEAS